MSNPDQPFVSRITRPPARAQRIRLGGLLGLALLWVMVAGSAVYGQSESVVIRSQGGNTGFLDEDDPNRIVMVFFGGVDITQGNRQMHGDTLVAILQRSAVTATTSRLGSDESTLPSDHVVELFVDGRVTLQEGDEQILGASSIYINHVKKTLTILEGEWRSNLSETPLIVRYRVMREHANGVREMEGVTYTTCDFAHAHWSIKTPWARLVPTDAGKVLHTSWNSVQLGGLPFVWMPGIHINVDRDRPPLRRVGFGTSSKFGTETNTTWGGDASDIATKFGEVLGVDGPVKADWELELNNYSRRGLFYQPKWTYETENSEGVVFGSYIHDEAKRDYLEQPIFDHTRGRFDLEHRTRIDEQKTVNIEVSYVSDQNYLREYYPQEERVDKPPETYINYLNVEDNRASSVLAQVRLNNYQTQVEYLPRFEYRMTGEQVETGPFGTAYFTTRNFADNVALRSSKLPPNDYGEPHPTQPNSERNIRAGTSGLVQWPIEVGGDRVTVTSGYDLTFFDRTSKTKDNPFTNPLDESESDARSAVRYALLGGVEWSRTYSGTAEYNNELWNMEGVRQILEPRVGYEGIFLVNEEPDDLLLIDRTETLAKRHAFIVGLRHRIQTHQQNEVVTTLDTDISIPFYPNEDRDNPIPEEGQTPDEFKGQTAGPLRVDMQWKPGANIPGLRRATIRYRSLYDTSGWKNLETFASYASDFGDDQRFIVSQNKVKNVSNFLSVGVQWVLTPRWTIAAYNQEDLLLNQNARRGILLRQQAHRWLIDVEVSRSRGRSRVSTTNPSNRDRNDTQITISFRPSFASEGETLLNQLGRIR
ncbi:MAG: LPS assembly protein LptD [Planctomycetota bacterium]|nr:LPS assembly protein LptD [Planctomycetota bacterium]